MMSDKNMTFEEAMKRIEQIASLMEQDNLPLESSLALYEEGISLVRHCSAELDKAERRIKQLTVSPDGELILADMPATEA